MTQNKRSPLFILMLLVFVFSVSMDIFLPALPEIQRVMQTTPLKVQFTLTIPMAVMAIGLCILGWFCDRFGRKSIALVFSLTFILGTYLCSISQSIEFLYLGRFVQTLGSSGMYVAAFSMAKDQSKDEYESSYTFGMMNACCALSPLLAPLLGSLLLIWGSWRWTFYSCILLGVGVLLLLTFFGKETLKKGNKTKQGIDEYKAVLKSRNFLAFVLPSASGMVCVFTYFSISPFVLIDQLGVPEQQFGAYFAFIVIGFVIGCLINGKLSYKYGLHKLSNLGSMLLFVSGALLVACYLFLPSSAYAYVICLIPSGLGASFLLSASTAQALKGLDHVAGCAVALLGFFQYSFSGVLGSIAMYLLSDNWLPMGGTLILLSAFGLAPMLLKSSQKESSEKIH